MTFAQDDDVIQAFAAHAAKEALAGRIHIGRSHRGLDDARSDGLRGAIEVGSEFVVAIANDETRRLPERRRVPDLFGGPRARGRPSDGDVQHFSSSLVDDEKREYRAEPDVVRPNESRAQMSLA